MASAPRRKVGVGMTAFFSLAAILVIGATFMSNASPYVDIDQARKSSDENLHLVGDIMQPSIHSDAMARSISFDLKDATGKTINVRYNGEAIANIGEATKVVAVGKVTSGVFESNKLLIKCPSKYDDAKYGKSATTSSAAIRS